MQSEEIMDPEAALRAQAMDFVIRSTGPHHSLADTASLIRAARDVEDFLRGRVSLGTVGSGGYTVTSAN